MRRLILASTLVSLSCSAAPSPVAPPVPVEPPAATPTVVATAPVVRPPPAAELEPPSPFQAVTKITLPVVDGRPRVSVELYKLGAELFVGTSSGGKVRLFPVRDDGLARDDVRMPDLFAGGLFELHGIQGGWPDHAYMLTVALDGGGRYHNTWSLYRRDAPKYPAKDPSFVWTAILNHDDPNSMAPRETSKPRWDGELTTTSDGRLIGRFDDQLRVLDGPKTPAASLPKLTVATECNGAARVAFGTRHNVSKLLALPSGHFVAVGANCAKEGLALEWFAPRATQGTVVTFGERCELLKVVGRRIDEITMLVACNRTPPVPAGTTPPTAEYEEVLLGFDGTKVTEIKRPGKGVVDIAVTDGGSLLVVGREPPRLHRRLADGAWQSTPLGEAVGTIAVRGEDDIWILGDDALFRNRPAGPPTSFVWPDDGAQVATSFRAPRAATSTCESLYVLFFAFAKTTPDDYDFPLTRAALKGHTDLADARLVVTRDGGRKYFGAFVPSLEVGKRLVATVQKGMKDAHPELLCAKPELVREIKMSWATGAVER